MIQSSVLPFLCVCVSTCCFRLYKSMISSKLSLSMLSSLFLGMFISPSIIGSPFCWSNVVLCSENSSRKILIGVPFFVELGGL